MESLPYITRLKELFQPQNSQNRTHDLMEASRS
jgi:hypothetical protein